MKDGFNYDEWIDYTKKLGIAKSKFDNWLKTFLLQQAQRCVVACKRRQRAVGAVDTGFMINSWVIGNEAKVLKANSRGKYTSSSVSYDSAFAQQASIDDIKVVGNSIEVTIGNTAEYASFIEYGQRSYEGKYILTISINTIESALPSRFQKEWEQFLKSGGIA